jgi:hypothetical protein
MFSSIYRFFLYTFPDEGAELFIKADLLLPIESVNAKLLYFLDFYLENGELKIHQRLGVPAVIRLICAAAYFALHSQHWLWCRSDHRC